MNTKELLNMYETMVRIRKFEEKVAELYYQARIPGIVHLYIGEEAVAVGVCGNLTERDYITSTHRGHGHLIAKGGELPQMMAEIYGKSTGYCQGKGGSMHICNPDLGILGANGIVGAGLPIAIGAAFSMKYQKKNEVVVCFFGDGANNQGSFHESLNFASIFDLPVIFVCENNLYGISLSQKRHMKLKNIADRGQAYGIHSEIVDGNDLFATYKAAGEAVERARAGKGPSLLEMKTYRWHGHSEGEPIRYRPEEEEEAWREKCPIMRMEKTLISEYNCTPEELAQKKEAIAKEVEDCVEFAEKSSYPQSSTLLENVYYGEIIKG